MVHNDERRGILRYILDAVSQVLEETTGGVSTRYLYGLDLLAQQRGGTTTYLGYDAMSVRLHLNSSGAVVGQYRYGPFGEVYGEEAEGYGYTGERWDHYIKMTYLRARYYSPAMGAFIERDSFPGNISSPASLNRFQYVGNNPSNYFDPSGHKFPAIARRTMLSQLGRALAGKKGDSLKKFIALSNFAAILVSNDVDEYMLDMNCVILGYCRPDISECNDYYRIANYGGVLWFPGHRALQANSDYFLGPTVFKGKGSWSPRYYDFTYGQMHHFWFYVGDAYIGSGPRLQFQEMGPTIRRTDITNGTTSFTLGWQWPAYAEPSQRHTSFFALVGNALHDYPFGGSTPGLCNEDSCDYNANGAPMGLGASIQDFLLGVEGWKLGVALKNSGVTPYRVGDWIWQHLSAQGVGEWPLVKPKIDATIRQLMYLRYGP